MVGESVPSSARERVFQVGSKNLARIEKRVYYMDGMSGWTLVRAAARVLSICWGLDRLSGFPVIHDVLEMKSEYFSMDSVIVRDA